MRPDKKPLSLLGFGQRFRGCCEPVTDAIHFKDDDAAHNAAHYAVQRADHGVYGNTIASSRYLGYSSAHFLNSYEQSKQGTAS
jgi:hypothetical protein